MNKRQKIVQEQFLNNEEAVIRRLKNQYHHALKDINKTAQSLQDDINRLGQMASLAVDAEEKAQLLSMQQSKIYQKQYQDAMKTQVGSILDKMQVEEFRTVSDYLQTCYEDGFVGTMFDLQGQGIPLCFPMDQEAMVRAVQLDSKIKKSFYESIGENVAGLKRAITAEVSRGISTGMSYAQIAQQLKARMVGNYDGKPGGALYRAMTIARTEGHRIQVQGTMDACYKARDKGADVVKQWDATLDDSTRESHVAVDGQIRELDKPFSNGLMFPGDPGGGAAEVVNCRCALLQRARWALDEDELKTLQERAEYFGLDNAENFEDFKKNYLQTSQYRSIFNNGSTEFVPVTPSSYNRLTRNIPITWDESQRGALEAALSDLLKDVEKVELGVECGAAYNKKLELISKFTGKSNAVTIPKQNVPYIAVHNHPDGLTFSCTDVERFIETGNLETLFAIGNNGSVYMLEKTDDYVAVDFINAYLRIETDYPNIYKTPDEYSSAMSKFLKGAEKYGVRYYEGTA